MIHLRAAVTAVERPSANLVLLRLRAPDIARQARAGQFINIRVTDSCFPLLRRPFSIYRAEGECIEIVFSVVGTGTSLIAGKREGDALDIIGPLGTPFTAAGPSVTAILVGGGLGVAPLPILHAFLAGQGTPIETYLGARTAGFILTRHLTNVSVATDDGSLGAHGTVVDLLRRRLEQSGMPKAKVYACGPTAMLKPLIRLVCERGIPCEVSLESAMACGFGICQGCPVRLSGGERTYALVCRDGTVFDATTVELA